MVLGTFGLFGGVAYYLWAHSESKETEMSSITIPTKTPAWFNKIKGAEGALPPDLKAAKEWAEAGDTEGFQNTAANWIRLFCAEEPRPNGFDKDYCNKNLDIIS